MTGAAGLLLIISAMLAPYPSAYPYLRATVAVAGALLLIGAAHPRPQDVVRRTLASRPAVWIGQRSYGLYLWHWPVLVLARWTTGLTAWPFNVGAVALSFLLAAASYRGIEQPFRTSAWLKMQPLGLRIGLFLLMMSAGWLSRRVLLAFQPQLGLGKVTREAADWYGDRNLLKTTLASSRRCEPVAEPVAIGPLPDVGTRYVPRDCPSRAASQLFVVGDSHAMAYRPMLEQLSAEQGRTVILLPTLGCSYLDMKDALNESTEPHCYRVARNVLRTVLAQASSGDIVFLSSLRLPRLVELGGARRDLKGDPYGRTAQELEGLGRAVGCATLDRTAARCRTPHRPGGPETGIPIASLCLRRVVEPLEPGVRRWTGSTASRHGALSRPRHERTTPTCLQVSPSHFVGSATRVV